MPRQDIAIVVAAILAIGTPAWASPPEPPLAPPDASTSLQSRPDQPGDVRTFKSTLEYGSEDRTERTVTRTFEIVTEKAGPDSFLELRFTVLEADADTEVDQTRERAWIGIPLRVIAPRQGLPIAVLNWADAKTRYVESVERLTDGRPEIREQILNDLRQVGDFPPSVDFNRLPEMMAMGSIQFRAVTRSDPVEETRMDNGDFYRLVDETTVTRNAEAPECLANVRHRNGIGGSVGGQSIWSEDVITGTVAIEDGWTVFLELVHTGPPAAYGVRRLQVSRTAPTPCATT